MQRGRAQAAGEGRAAAEGASPPLVTAWLLLFLLSALLVPGAVTHAVARLLPFSRVDGAGPAVVRERLPAQLSATLMVVMVGVACRLLVRTADLSPGLGFFSGSVALPAMTLRAVASLELPAPGVERARALRLIGACTAARAAGFAASLWAARQRARRSVSPPLLQARLGGLLAIATTQTNDFAFGLSVLQALETTPLYTSMVYLLVPVQLLCFTMPGMWLLARGGASHGHGRHLKADDDLSLAENCHMLGHHGSAVSVCANDGAFVDGGAEPAQTSSVARRAAAFLLASPLLLALVTGLVANVCAGGLPRPVDEGLSTLGSSFAGTALFLVGYEGARFFDMGTVSPRRSGGYGVQVAREAVVTPARASDVRELTLTALALKLVLLPLSSVAAAIVLRLPASDAAFVALLGSLPSAPSLAIFAQQGAPEYNAVASLTLVLGLLGSVPCVIAAAEALALAREWR